MGNGWEHGKNTLGGGFSLSLQKGRVRAGGVAFLAHSISLSVTFMFVYDCCVTNNVQIYASYVVDLMFNEMTSNP